MIEHNVRGTLAYQRQELKRLEDELHWNEQQTAILRDKHLKLLKRIWQHKQKIHGLEARHGV